jgi:NAD(P)-dependent dehydrogenase (short-subunit alcohol dehydrogenase family)
MVTTRRATAEAAQVKRSRAAAKTPAKAARKPAMQGAESRPTKPARPAAAKAVKAVKQVSRLIRHSPVGKAGATVQAMRQAGKSSRLAKEVRNKVVVVTGASSGIGEDCALKLGAAGAVVILAARTPAKLQQTLDKIEQRGGRAFAYACDISDLADCDRFCQTVLQKHGHVDILINNAGRSIRRSVKLSFDRFHDFERTMQLNYFGALRLIFGFAPTMLSRKQGHIINISSIGVLASPPRFSAYVASKAALDAFSWCAASEFADSHVRFTTVNMPLVRTPMIAPTRLYDAFPALSPDEAAELVMNAVIDKPKRVATGLGLLGAVAQALTPGVSEFVLNQAFRLFPDSLPAKGQAGDDTDGSPLSSPLRLGRRLFSQVFGGVYW